MSMAIKKNIQRMLYVLKFYLQGSPRERGDHGAKRRNCCHPRGSEGIRFAKQSSGVFQSKTMKKSQNI